MLFTSMPVDAGVNVVPGVLEDLAVAGLPFGVGSCGQRVHQVIPPSRMVSMCAASDGLNSSSPPADVDRRG
jgi:hypothetical protein